MSTNVELLFGIGKHRVQPGVWRVCCRLCGVRGNERAPKIGMNCSTKEIRGAVRKHATMHHEKALEEHRERELAKVEPAVTVESFPMQEDS